MRGRLRQSGPPGTVKVGVRHGDQVQIVEGLQAGERVVGVGAYGLPDNTQDHNREAETASERHEKAVAERKSEPVRNPRHWFAHYSKPVIFLILTLALLGAYLAFTIPVQFFPTPISPAF